MTDHGLGIQIMATTSNVPNVGVIASGIFRHRTKVKNKFFRYTGENEQIWLSTPPWQLQTPIKMFILYVCVLLETESRTLYMLGKSLSIELYAPKICTMGIHTYF